MTFRLALILALGAAPAMALAPPPPCDGAIGSGMRVGAVRSLGAGCSGTSGAPVETCRNAVMLSGETHVRRPAPLPQLEGIDATRVLHRASGACLVIDGVGPDEADAALSATEFLRGRPQAGEPVAFRDVPRAAEAPYGAVTVPGGTDRTCACAVFFPEALPAGGLAYSARSDIEF